MKVKRTFAGHIKLATFSLLSALALFLLVLLPAQGHAQVCSDCGNFGTASNSAATLEYDNFVSSFHSTIVRDRNSNLKIWGDRSKSTSSSSDYSWLVPTAINSSNFSGLTGKPLIGAIGSTSSSIQHILLTDDNKLWAWGSAGIVVSTGVKSGNTISSFSLPAGVTAADVKMIFATNGTLVLTTCESKGGRVYVLSMDETTTGSGGNRRYHYNMRGDNSVNFTSSQASKMTTWATVQKSTGGDLTNIVAARGCSEGLIALDKTGSLWTWGNITYNNNSGTSATGRGTATTLPQHATATGSIKMIGATGTGSVATYYILYENGNLWAIGNNDNRQLGNWGTTSSNTWLQPRYTSSTGQVMNNIAWISPNEHDDTYPFINVLTTDGVVYNWGAESGNALARGQGTSTSGSTIVNPGAPTNFKGSRTNSGIIAVESGGHTTLILKECEANFGYVGHYVRGSMGDGRAGGNTSTESSFTFETTAVQVCGAATSDASIDVSVNTTEFCRQAPIMLYPNPTGGTFSITTGSNIASLSGTSGNTPQTLSFTGTGEVVVTYTVTSGNCQQANTSKTFVVVNCDPTVTIPGKIWVDKNVNASEDASPSDGGGTNNGGELWANLVGPDGKVIQSVKVNPDGTFNIIVPKSDLSAPGDYKVIITTSSQDKGGNLTASDTPTGYSYTGTNRGGSSGANGPNTTNRTGLINVGNLNTAGNNSIQAPVNFGIKEGVLPVHFGSISARLTGDLFMVSWTSEKETNNDRFEIEASADGVNFTTIGTVKSKAENGNSSSSLHYEFSKSITGGVIALSLLTLGGVGFFASRKRKALFVLAVVAGLSVFYMSCQKANDTVLENGKFFVRVVQIDVDGTKTYSKVITVVKE